MAADPKEAKPGSIHQLLSEAQERTQETVMENPHTQLLRIPLDDLLPNPHQYRQSDDEVAMQVLVNSIQKNGQIQPGQVRAAGTRDGRQLYELVCGHRRWEALKRLRAEAAKSGRRQWTHFEAKLSDLDASDSVQMISRNLDENLCRLDAPPIETAEGVAKRFQTSGMPLEELALELHWEPRKLERYLQVASAPAEVKAICGASRTVQRSDRVGATLRYLDISLVLELVKLHRRLVEGRGWKGEKALGVVKDLVASAFAEDWSYKTLKDHIDARFGEKKRSAGEAKARPGAWERIEAALAPGLKQLAKGSREARLDVAGRLRALASRLEQEGAPAPNIGEGV